MTTFARTSVAIILQLATVLAFAAGKQTTVPECMDRTTVLPVMNQEVLQLRESKQSGYMTRALVTGKVVEVYADSGSHLHFSIQLDKGPEDRIEVVYNTSFGRMPIPQVGEDVSACGDYIVATKQNGKFPPSPDGAIIHWVHMSPSKGKNGKGGGGHDHGYVVLGGTLYGFAGNGKH